MTERRLLITGFPGLRARAVLTAALERAPAAEIVLLVHRRRRAEADSALETLPQRSGVSLVEGDPAAIDFGLARGAYFELAASVTEVQHLYQVLDPAQPAALAESANIGGVREIIEFARVARRLTRVVHHSSVFVSGDRRGVVAEGELAAGQSFRSPVTRTLALGEAMLRRQASLPLTVLRAGHIVGDTKTGVMDRLDGPYPLLVLLASTPPGTPLPLPPRADAAVYVTPVDYLARAALAAADLPAAHGATLHLTEPSPISVGRLLELAGAHFGVPMERGIHPRALGRALLGNPGVGLLAQNLRTMIDLISNPVSYDDRVAASLLGPLGIRCPVLETYLDVLLAHVEARVAEKRVAEPAHKEPWDVAG